mmetsp:Transcript_46280/g.122825  ORF Transcript_46280/g.122825 Transcript_46280/m.122825 type:complete len:752 (-) Transcript_46280:59-2314(-)|eukprot:CAMPEP_0194533096 /NCGR_PEP_ID=MMETSP0253-20130528/70872_1 /TAXON_ID=2966 /ORGANISM="Noctiluca scintillans" /LENGTH=751 /DNA_ID=CAMNT_0039378617 /DNA_START=138 /DNA_END=2393 /DNA_ORIENTATION=-
MTGIPATAGTRGQVSDPMEELWRNSPLSGLYHWQHTAYANVLSSAQAEGAEVERAEELLLFAIDRFDFAEIQQGAVAQTWKQTSPAVLSERNELRHELDECGSLAGWTPSEIAEMSASWRKVDEYGTQLQQSHLHALKQVGNKIRLSSQVDTRITENQKLHDELSESREHAVRMLVQLRFVQSLWSMSEDPSQTNRDLDSAILRRCEELLVNAGGGESMDSLMSEFEAASPLRFVVPALCRLKEGEPRSDLLVPLPGSTEEEVPKTEVSIDSVQVSCTGFGESSDARCAAYVEVQVGTSSTRTALAACSVGEVFLDFGQEKMVLIVQRDSRILVRVRKSFGNNVTLNDTIVGEAVLPWNSVRHRGSQRLQVPLSCNMMQVGELSLRLQARRLEAAHSTSETAVCERLQRYVEELTDSNEKLNNELLSERTLRKDSEVEVREALQSELQGESDARDENASTLNHDIAELRSELSRLEGNLPSLQREIEDHAGQVRREEFQLQSEQVQVRQEKARSEALQQHVRQASRTGVQQTKRGTEAEVAHLKRELIFAYTTLARFDGAKIKDELVALHRQANARAERETRSSVRSPVRSASRKHVSPVKEEVAAVRRLNAKAELQGAERFSFPSTVARPSFRKSISSVLPESGAPPQNVPEEDASALQRRADNHARTQALGHPSSPDIVLRSLGSSVPSPWASTSTARALSTSRATPAQVSSSQVPEARAEFISRLARQRNEIAEFRERLRREAWGASA